ncbi:unnamed protein product [Paramecium octaurelia]|uniref:Uncharacterized protein n=1 Tax=Paramecium octaurelia TaxID=43137 RepID=A0A8S1Y1N5_PAROT|nr:unnamed protein product [Paramecium octaurelia]
MAPLISFLKIIFLKSIIYENCLTDNVEDCIYTDFTVVGLTNGTLDRCGSDPHNLYIGPYGYQSQVSKTFTNVPPNNLIEWQVGIWKMDSWDMEGLEFYANDIQLESLYLNLHDGTMICRNDIWEDQYTPVIRKFKISGTDLTIKIKDNLQTQNWGPGLENFWDESWGFRDVILSLAVPCVSFYSECNYAGTLFQICKGEQSKMLDDIPFEIKSIQMGPGIIVKLKGPNYFGGVLQEITASTSCLDAFQFPNVILKE